MKKLIVLVVLMFGVINAQTWTKLGSTGGGLSELVGITAWAPFTSDSVGIQISDPLDISGVDSIHVWSSAISSGGTAHLVGAFQAGFSATWASTTHDSLASVIDTTNAKLETMNQFSTIYPKGAQWAFIRVNPKSGGTLANNFYTGRKDAILNFYFRLYYSRQNGGNR